VIYKTEKNIRVLMLKLNKLRYKDSRWIQLGHEYVQWKILILLMLAVQFLLPKYSLVGSSNIYIFFKCVQQYEKERMFDHTYLVFSNIACNIVILIC
jgi:hypothetical protein